MALAQLQIELRERCLNDTSTLVTNRPTMRHLLAALAWLGLVLAPIAMPAAAMSGSIEMAVAHVHDSATDMRDDMPCCPQSQKVPDCAKDCPSMALCAGMAFPIVTGSAVSAPAAVIAVIVPSDDARLNGLAQGPPARPPKS